MPMHNPPHPGETLLVDVLPELGITVTGLVHVVLLRPLLDLEGALLATDPAAGKHRQLRRALGSSEAARRPRLEGSIAVRDGRRLGFASFGTPSGRPIWSPSSSG